MANPKLDLLQGTLDVMVLQTLHAIGPLHGYGVARRIEQISGNQVLLNQGTIYASLVRLQQRGWIAAEWGASDNNRKAKFYSITRNGRKQLAADAAHWQRLADVMGRMLAMSPGGETR
ncbi:MAG: PadR family transcriptional regulator [Bryobacteraceae bacterium]|jgi:transcriptional regulator